MLFKMNKLKAKLNYNIMRVLPLMLQINLSFNFFYYLKVLLLSKSKKNFFLIEFKNKKNLESVTL
jgi:hypothetical protein